MLDQILGISLSHDINSIGFLDTFMEMSYEQLLSNANNYLEDEEIISEPSELITALIGLDHGISDYEIGISCAMIKAINSQPGDSKIVSSIFEEGVDVSFFSCIHENHMAGIINDEFSFSLYVAAALSSSFVTSSDDFLFNDSFNLSPDLKKIVTESKNGWMNFELSPLEDSLIDEHKIHLDIIDTKADHNLVANKLTGWGDIDEFDDNFESEITPIASSGVGLSVRIIICMPILGMG